MPNRRWKSVPIALSPGGIQDSKAIPEAGDLAELSNFINFRGRWGIRPGLIELTAIGTLTTDGATPVTAVLDAADFNGEFWFISFHSTAGTQFHRYDKDGTFKERGAIWTDTTKPLPILAVMAASDLGDPDLSQERLYISDWLQNAVHPTKFIVPDNVIPFVSPVSSLQARLDGSATSRNVIFSYIMPYQFHLWGTGFLHNDGTSNIFRGELIRFSRPGLFPQDDPDSLQPLQEWWQNDWFGVGQRAEKIVALSQAGRGMLIAKRRELYIVEGFDRNSFAVAQLSRKVGIIAPRAHDFTDEGLCFFWSERGPQLTDGQRIEDIGEPIRKRIQLTNQNDLIGVQYSSDDNLIYFTLTHVSGQAPDRWVAFDTKRQAWAEGEWFLGVGSRLLIGALRAVGEDVPPGPEAAPSGLQAANGSVILTWINGDTGLGTTTEIERSAVGCLGFAKIGEVAAGVATFEDTTVTPATKFCYRVRHVRNTQTSAYSNVVTDFATTVAAPSGLEARGLSTGVRVVFNNNQNLADIEIHRRLIAGVYALHATLVAQATGQIVHDDTVDIACGTVYQYKARALLSGFPTSGFSNEDSQESCLPGPDLISVTGNVDITQGCPGADNVQISYQCDNVEPTDTRKVYRIVDGGAPELISTAALQTQETVGHIWQKKCGCDPTGQVNTIVFRVEAFEDGITLSDTLDSAEFCEITTDC